MACDPVAGSSLQVGGDGCCVLTDEIEEKITMVLRYRVALYWAVTTLTTIGYGDITPKSTLEQWTAMVAMAAGAFLFGMLLGTLSAQITAGNIADQEYDKQMETVREFLRAKKVNVEQRRKIMAFYDNYFHSKTVFAEETLLEKLPEQMRMDLMRQMYDDLVSSSSTRGAVLIPGAPHAQSVLLPLPEEITDFERLVCCTCIGWPARVDKPRAVLQLAK